MQSARRVYRPLNWRITALEELEGLGIMGRAEQARAMEVSLPQLDRVRRAARRERDGGAKPSRQRRPRSVDPSTRVSLRVRVPSPVLYRLKRYSTRMGISVALATAFALDDWLAGKGVAGPSGLGRNLRQRLGL